MNNTRHCRPVTKGPQTAQTTNAQFKTETLVDLVTYTSNLAIAVTRGKPWGVVFPDWFDNIDDFGGADDNTD